MSSVKQTKKQSQMIMGGDPRRAKKSLSKKSKTVLSTTYEFKISQLCQRERPNIETLNLDENLSKEHSQVKSDMLFNAYKPSRQDETLHNVPIKQSIYLRRAPIKKYKQIPLMPPYLEVWDKPLSSKSASTLLFLIIDVHGCIYDQSLRESSRGKTSDKLILSATPIFLHSDKKKKKFPYLKFNTLDPLDIYSEKNETSQKKSLLLYKKRRLSGKEEVIFYLEVNKDSEKIMDLLLTHKNEVELFTNYCKISTKDDYSSWDLDNPPTRTGFPKTQLSNVFPLIESMTNIDDDSNTSGTLASNMVNFSSIYHNPIFNMDTLYQQYIIWLYQGYLPIPGKKYVPVLLNNIISYTSRLYNSIDQWWTGRDQYDKYTRFSISKVMSFDVDKYYSMIMYDILYKKGHYYQLRSTPMYWSIKLPTDHLVPNSKDLLSIEDTWPEVNELEVNSYPDSNNNNKRILEHCHCFMLEGNDITLKEIKNRSNLIKKICFPSYDMGGLIIDQGRFMYRGRQVHNKKISIISFVKEELELELLK